MSSSSIKLMGILAVVAVLLFVGLIGLQAMEILHYRADPSVWPLP